MNTSPQILVIGGGSAGVAAAVAASRAGADVLLLERYSFLGGKASGAEVGTICGLYTYSRSSVSEYAAGGFMKEFAEALQIRSGTAPLFNTEGLHYLPYRPFDFKCLCDDLLMENKVKVCFHATVCGVQTESGRITAVEALVFDRRLSFFPAAVIDCSGEAIISSLAGMKLLENEEYQAAAQVFTLERVSGTDEARLGMMLIKSIMKGIAEKKIREALDRITIVPGSLRDGSVQLKIGIAHPVLNSPDRSAALELLARRSVREITDYLIAHTDAFKDAHLGDVAMESGIRVGRRPLGKYVLTEEDVMSCRKPDDGIANAAWPIEIWGQDKRVRMKYFAEKGFYQIPAGCLRSAELENLFFAGRNISATDAAIASARVIGTCLQTGAAAGRLAAAACMNMDEKKVIGAIRSEL